MTTPDQQSGAAEARFVVFTACILASLAVGYLLRRRGLARGEWSPLMMSAAIVACDAPVALLAIWFLQMEADVWKVPVAGAAVGVAACLLGLAVARWRRMAPADAAVFGLQAGMGNVGYTLGGALALVLWGIQGLALEQMFCMMWPFFAFLFCFPVARHYGERAAAGLPGAAAADGYPAAGPARGRSAGDLVAYAAGVLGRSLADVRSLPLYAATLGLALNLAHAPPPEFVRRWRLIDAVMVAGILLQFGGVGMTVRGSQLLVYWKAAMGSAAIKFLVSPALMLAAGLATGMTGTPLAVCLLLAAMPTAIYSVLMANLFGLNKDLANTTFILTHAVCLAVAVPALILWHGLR